MNLAKRIWRTDAKLFPHVLQMIPNLKIRNYAYKGTQRTWNAKNLLTFNVL